MPTTPELIVEDGTGLDDANSYISVADANTYIEGRLNAEKWTAANADTKAQALIMATRSIDVNMEWAGYRVHQTQALDWPRLYVPDKRYSFDHWTRNPLAPVGTYGPEYPSDEVPKRIAEATAELALELLKTDRAAEWDAMGVSGIGLGQGAISVDFTSDAAALKKMFTPEVSKMLAPFGNSVEARAQARVSRG